VFTRADPDDEIWVMNADGSDAQRRTDNAIADFAPEWSPDGTRIV
jgi:Tol biopolymer transport system component